ncbi:RHS repeat-associated core domain-containing protein [Vreelandella sp. GE22]
MRHENGTIATTHYGWDGDRIVREESENQRSTIVYEPGSFVPMLRIDDTQQGPQLSAFVTDAIGTPMQLVAANGETQWQGQPDDWAAVRNVRGNTTQPIRFQGQWQDEESGLYYNRHRYYDPQQGRYISQDPIGLRGGTNLYGYVANPMGAVDPLGLTPLSQCGQENALRETSMQRDLRLAEDVEGYYTARAEAGDAYAARALMVVRNECSSFDACIMASANFRLKSAAFFRGIDIDTKDVQVRLMNAHANAVEQDDLGVPGLLNPVQIAEYHHDIFNDLGLPNSTFGGTPITGTPGEATVWDWLWCKGCDSK